MSVNQQNQNIFSIFHISFVNQRTGIVYQGAHPSMHRVAGIGKYLFIRLFIPVRNSQSLLDLTHMCLDGGRKLEHLHKHRKNMHTRKPPAQLIPCQNNTIKSV